jgi:mannose-6-phosphate isomerase-like protein (cupin superfamily)
LAWKRAVSFLNQQYQRRERAYRMKVSDPASMPPELWRPGVETRMVVSAKNGAAQLCIFEQWVAPGVGAPTHSHPVEEVLTVRAGEAEMWIDEERAIVTAGQSLIVPAGRLHGFRNSGTVTLHVHAVLASPVFEQTMEGAAEVIRRWTPA